MNEVSDVNWNTIILALITTIGIVLTAIISGIMALLLARLNNKTQLAILAAENTKAAVEEGNKVAVETKHVAEVTSEKTDKVLAKTEEIHVSTNSNLEKMNERLVASDEKLVAANKQIEALQKSLEVMQQLVKAVFEKQEKENPKPAELAIVEDIAETVTDTQERVKVIEKKVTKEGKG